MPAYVAKKKGGNKKGQKMSLGDFLNEGPADMSWADETIALPSAPMAVTGTAPPQRPSLANAPDRKDLPPAPAPAPADFPTSPPFTAYIGNLPFSVDEERLREFFDNSEDITSVRLVRDRMTERLKGFGYVEFATAEKLKWAVLEMSGREMDGRQLRINISESTGSHHQREGRAPQSAAMGASNWRRSGDLPPPVAPAPQAASGMTSRSSSGFGRHREHREPREPREPTAAEATSDWRVHKEPAAPTESAPAPAPAARRTGSSFGDRFSRSSSNSGRNAGGEADSRRDTGSWRNSNKDTNQNKQQQQQQQQQQQHQQRREYKQPAAEHSAGEWRRSSSNNKAQEEEEEEGWSKVGGQAKNNTGGASERRSGGRGGLFGKSQRTDSAGVSAEDGGSWRR